MTGVRPPSDETLHAKHALDQSRWWESAACVGAPFRIFDTDEGRGSKAQARAICAGCPVRSECRQDADLLPDPSFRAGYTAKERSRQNREKRNAS